MAPSEEQKPFMALEALPAEQPLVQVQGPEPEDREGAGTSPVDIIGFAFLTFSWAMAASSWDRSFGAVSFLLFCCLDLHMLFYCLHLYERTPPGSPQRELLKMATWLLANLLTITVFQLLELWFLTTMGKN